MARIAESFIESEAEESEEEEVYSSSDESDIDSEEEPPTRVEDANEIYKVRKESYFEMFKAIGEASDQTKEMNQRLDDCMTMSVYDISRNLLKAQEGAIKLTKTLKRCATYMLEYIAVLNDPYLMIHLMDLLSV